MQPNEIVSFLNLGNAHRSDIATNVTVREFEEWLVGLAENPDLELKVHKHKTADVYGAGRVDMRSMKDLFLAYGQARMTSCPEKDEPLFYNMPNFSVSWAKVRKSVVDVKCSDYRKFVETRVNMMHVTAY